MLNWEIIWTAVGAIGTTVGSLITAIDLPPCLRYSLASSPKYISRLSREKRIVSLCNISHVTFYDVVLHKLGYRMKKCIFFNHIVIHDGGCKQHISRVELFSKAVMS